MTPDQAKKLRSLIANWLSGSLGTLLALVAVVIFFWLADSMVNGEYAKFMSVRNLRVVLTNTSLVAVAALGMTMIIIAGGIDLSAGTALTLSATVLAYGLKNDFPPTLAVLLCLLTAVVCGLANGALISLLRIIPFIVTLGTMTIFLGIGKLVSNQTTIFPSAEQRPDWISDLCSTRPPDLLFTFPIQPSLVWIALLGVLLVTALLKWKTLASYMTKIPGIKPVVYCLCGILAAVMVLYYFGKVRNIGVPNLPLAVWITLLLSIVVSAILRFSVFGRYVFALGSNEATARLCGLNIPLIKMAVYALAGLFVGVAGMYHFGLLKMGNPVEGLGLELKVIAAVVIGGGSLHGGRGSVIGTLAGASIMGVITSGCDQLEVPNPYQDIIIGTIIIAAVLLDQVRERRLSA